LGRLNVVAVVQARMGSSRLPGKVLEDILGKPILWHIVRRLRASAMVTRVVIAAPDSVENKPIIKFAKDNEIDCYAGSENDLLDRTYQAAKPFNPDVVVWITADCPLIDPGVVDRVLQYYLDNRGQYDVIFTAGPLQEKGPVPDGLDTCAFNFQVFEQAWRDVRDPFWREWFAAGFSRDTGKYRFGTLPVDRVLSNYRWTVDYPDDLEFIRTIYQRLHREDSVFLMDDVLKLLEESPELVKINQDYIWQQGYVEALKNKHVED
jgi:spore coat polysaccharide biosynthesis protein SpsF